MLGWRTGLGSRTSKCLYWVSSAYGESNSYWQLLRYFVIHMSIIANSLSLNAEKQPSTILSTRSSKAA